MGEAKRKMNQAYMQVRLNIILAHLQHKNAFPDLQEVERIARYCVDGPTIQPIHGILQNNG